MKKMIIALGLTAIMLFAGSTFAADQTRTRSRDQARSTLQSGVRDQTRTRDQLKSQTKDQTRTRDRARDGSGKTAK